MNRNYCSDDCPNRPDEEIEPHECPFKSTINRTNGDELCDCCDRCSGGCAEEI